jgi:hypothetical protein
MVAIESSKERWNETCVGNNDDVFDGMRSSRAGEEVWEVAKGLRELKEWSCHKRIHRHQRIARKECTGVTRDPNQECQRHQLPHEKGYQSTRDRTHELSGLPSQDERDEKANEKDGLHTKKLCAQTINLFGVDSRDC